MHPAERLALIAVVLGALLACGEAYPYVLVRVRVPTTGAPDPAKLHLEADNSSDRAFVPHLSHADPLEPKAFPGGVDLELQTSIGPTRYVYVHAWYDANGNGRVDSGDAIGDLSPAPFAAHDRGGCASNKNRAPDLVLVRVP